MGHGTVNTCLVLLTPMAPEPIAPTGPTEHLQTVDYWRDLYTTAVEVGQEMLATARKEQARLALALQVAKRDLLRTDIAAPIPGLAEIEKALITITEALDPKARLDVPTGG